MPLEEIWISKNPTDNASDGIDGAQVEIYILFLILIMLENVM